MEPDITSTSQTNTLRRPMPNDRYVYWVQQIVRRLVVIIRLLLGRRVVIDTKPSEIDSNLRYIIAPNHGSWLDPLVIMHHIPNGVFRKVGPIRVLTGNRLINSPLRPFILSLGSFPARPHRRYRYGLELAQEYVDNGAFLAIFPEGRRNVNRTVKPRRGVAQLTNAEDIRLIPVHIEWTRHLFGILATYKIHMGSPVKVAGLSAEQIMDKVYALPL